MLNRHRLRELALANDLPVRKQLKTWVRGELVVLEVDRPLAELADDLRARGLLA